jgi:phytol kinase
MLPDLLFWSDLMASPWRNGIATLVTFAAAWIWLRLMNGLAQRGILKPTLSRKLIHLGTGPLFVLCWPLFSASPQARFWAALVPLTITLKFTAIGLGWIRDSAAVASMTRHNDHQEMLKGPLYYGVMTVVCTLGFWRSSPVGIAALMMMCGGDGLADIVGRRWGLRKLPFSTHKSWVGSTAMLVGSFSLALLYVALFNAMGSFQPVLSVKLMGLGLAAIALAATLVEALPLPDIDNLTLTSTALVLGQVWWLGLGGQLFP